MSDDHQEEVAASPGAAVGRIWLPAPLASRAVGPEAWSARWSAGHHTAAAATAGVAAAAEPPAASLAAPAHVLAPCDPAAATQAAGAAQPSTQFLSRAGHLSSSRKRSAPDALPAYRMTIPQIDGAADQQVGHIFRTTALFTRMVKRLSIFHSCFADMGTLRLLARTRSNRLTSLDQLILTLACRRRRPHRAAPRGHSSAGGSSCRATAPSP